MENLYPGGNAEPEMPLPYYGHQEYRPLSESGSQKIQWGTSGMTLPPREFFPDWGGEPRTIEDYKALFKRVADTLREEGILGPKDEETPDGE